LLSVIGSYLLWRRAEGQPRVQIVAACFGLSMMILYAASTLYHAVRVPLEQLRYFLLVDLSAIYVLIAGTYTPVILLLPKGWRRMAFFAIIWLIAGVGIAFKVMVVADVMSPPVYWVSALFYLGMGWLGLGMILDIVRAVGLHGLRWAMYGGIAYSLGVVVDIQHEPNFWPGIVGYHELFHVFVVIGTMCHFMFIWLHVIPYAVAKNAPQAAILPMEAEVAT